MFGVQFTKILLRYKAKKAICYFSKTEKTVNSQFKSIKFRNARENMG